MAAGERIGLIRFGSRVDVLFAGDGGHSRLTGQTAIGGETVLAELASGESDARQEPDY